MQAELVLHLKRIASKNFLVAEWPQQNLSEVPASLISNSGGTSYFVAM
jgi:hypothetical protein